MKRNTGWALHVVRNPWGWSDEDQRAARLMLADAYEVLERKKQPTVSKLHEALLKAGATISVDPEASEPRLVRIVLKVDNVTQVVEAL